MFGTWRYDSLNNDIIVTDQDRALSSHNDAVFAPIHTACNKCRAEKLKCSGDKTGCSRCRASNTRCVYTKPSREGASKRQRQRLNAPGETSWRGITGIEARARSEDEAKSSDSYQGRKCPSESPEDQPGGRSVGQPSAQGLQQLTPPKSEPDSNLPQVIQDVFPPNDFDSATVVAMEADLGCEQMGTGNKSYDWIPEHHSNVENECQNSSAWSPRISRSPAFRPMRSVETLPSEAVLIDSPWYLNSPGSSQFDPPMPHFRNDFVYLDPGSPAQKSSGSLNIRRQPCTDFPTSEEHCQCLDEIGTLLPDLEHHRSRAATAPLDSTLSYHRSALGKLNALVSCQRCRTRPEFLVLLGVICEKSTALCEEMLSQHSRRSAIASPTLKKDDRLMTKSGEEIDIAEAYGNGTTTKTAFLGDYEVNSVTEWQLLMKVLVGIQLSSLHNMLNVIKNLMTSLPNGAQHGTLLTTIQKRVRNLATNPVRKEAEEGKPIPPI